MEAIHCPYEISKIELAAEVVRRFGKLRLRVVGSSMLPVVQPGDELVVRRCDAQDVRAGEIILFTRGRRLFAHRVRSVRESDLLQTQGDTLGQPDPVVTPNELLGIVEKVCRREHVNHVPSRLTFAARMAAALFRRCVPAVRIFTRLQGLRAEA